MSQRCAAPGRCHPRLRRRRSSTARIPKGYRALARAPGRRCGCASAWTKARAREGGMVRGGDLARPAPEFSAERLGMKRTRRAAPARRRQEDLRRGQRRVRTRCRRRSRGPSAGHSRAWQRKGGAGHQAEHFGRRGARADAGIVAKHGWSPQWNTGSKPPPLNGRRRRPDTSPAPAGRDARPRTRESPRG
jgi:hypothetical protein